MAVAVVQIYSITPLLPQLTVGAHQPLDVSLEHLSLYCCLALLQPRAQCYARLLVTASQLIVNVSVSHSQCSLSSSFV